MTVWPLAPKISGNLMWALVHWCDLASAHHWATTPEGKGTGYFSYKCMAAPERLDYLFKIVSNEGRGNIGTQRIPSEGGTGKT